MMEDRLSVSNVNVEDNQAEAEAASELMHMPIECFILMFLVILPSITGLLSNPGCRCTMPDLIRIVASLPGICAPQIS